MKSANATDGGTMDVWNQCACDNQVPSSRNGFKLRVGGRVKRVDDDTEVRIVAIHSRVRKNCDGVPARHYTIDTDDGGCVDDESVYVDDLDAEDERTSFCERCYTHFDCDFVTWSFDLSPERKWLDLLPPWRGRQRLTRSHSSCERCEALQPTGRVLWRFLRQRDARGHRRRRHAAAVCVLALLFASLCTFLPLLARRLLARLATRGVWVRVPPAPILKQFRHTHTHVRTWSGTWSGTRACGVGGARRSWRSVKTRDPHAHVGGDC